MQCAMPDTLDEATIGTHQPHRSGKWHEVVEQVPLVHGVLHGACVGNGGKMNGGHK